MKLTHEEANLCLDLQHAILAWYNQEHGIVEGIESRADIEALSVQELAPIRDAVWRNLSWIDDFIEAHRACLPAKSLDIVQSWKHAIVGEQALILKQLKRHAIFLLGGKAYGVLALTNTFDEVLGPSGMPILADVVLLPFEDRITYDGVLMTYSVTFGGGMRKSFEDEYRQAKKRGRFITSLSPHAAAPAPARPKPKTKPAWRDLTNDIVASSEKLRGGAPLTSSAFSLLRASAKLAQATASHPDDLDALDRLETTARRALTKFRNILLEEQYK